MPSPGQPKLFPLRLPKDLAADLHAFCEAVGAFHTKVICRAVSRYIDEQLRDNPGLRNAFDKERQSLFERERRGQPGAIRLLTKVRSSQDPPKGQRAKKKST